MRKAHLRDASVDFGLAGQIGNVPDVPVGVCGQRHVQFRDVDLNAQRREAGDVGGDAGEIQVLAKPTIWSAFVKSKVF